jgi:hypothetical protein
VVYLLDAFGPAGFLLADDGGQLWAELHRLGQTTAFGHLGVRDVDRRQENDKQDGGGSREVNFPKVQRRMRKETKPNCKFSKMLL